MYFAINRLALINEKECMMRLHRKVVSGNMIEDIKFSQNIVMYMHALSIHRIYDLETLTSVWFSLMKRLILLGSLKNRDKAPFNYTLALTLELFEIDNP